MSTIQGLKPLLKELGIGAVNAGASDGKGWFGHGAKLDVVSPINGQRIAQVKQADTKDYERVIKSAAKAFTLWREVPAPVRGQVVRQLGDEFRRMKKPLGRLVTIEMGKSLQEGYGEVQEAVDICDLACGQSRMLYGVTTKSERARHRMYEQWHPLGIVGVITAFNFPVAVWAWNASLALACGDVVTWKPASATPLTAIACQKIIQKVLKNNGMPPAVSTLVVGRGSEVGERLINDRRVPLISYTGSCTCGRHIGETVGGRLGKTILELGGNNAIIVTAKADLDLAAKNILFGAVGTAGQRCTTTRRVIIADKVYSRLVRRLKQYYAKVTIGSPLNEKYLMGPLINPAAVEVMMDAIRRIKKQGGSIAFGGKKLSGAKYRGGCYVTPALAEVKADLPLMQEETFAPLLYLTRYRGALENALKIHNNVPQGLSSSIFTNDLTEAETFLSTVGSDCGIANVNLGTSGAEIGLAFGGEKETGGGRESGSDAWKSYMRRQSTTINWSGATKLAQGIKF